MHDTTNQRREQALAIWHAGIDAVRPSVLLPRAVADASLGLSQAVASASRIVVVGAGKAGGAMTQSLLDSFPQDRDRFAGLVNVPDEAVPPQQGQIELHGARPAASNHPTERGVAGARRMLDLLRAADPGDIGIVLLSGGASALLPLPCPGITLAEKQAITLLLHKCGATIGEMNTVRKHLSAIKGGRLAQAFAGSALYSLILSDVIGDPLDVIGSGPTVADPSTYADALAVLGKYHLISEDPVRQGAVAPSQIVRYLQAGAAGIHSETPKQTPGNVHNRLIGTNASALQAAATMAKGMGFQVHSLGSEIQGDTAGAATEHVKVIRSMIEGQSGGAQPICLLSGGETTVNLTPGHGRGGRNQQFALHLLVQMAAEVLSRVTAVIGGTDGEDGPTDAAGAIVDSTTLSNAQSRGLRARDALVAQDAYPFFDQSGGLLKTGLTQTNVMDLRVMLLFPGG
jgi:hydroxypyruvate reductase/glycerate 2-kinase